MYQDRIVIDVRDNEGNIHTFLTHASVESEVRQNVLSTFYAHEKQLNETPVEDKPVEEEKSEPEVEKEEES